MGAFNSFLIPYKLEILIIHNTCLPENNTIMFWFGHPNLHYNLFFFIFRNLLNSDKEKLLVNF